MKTGMNLADLITEVKRQDAAKIDLLADTREQVRMVEMPGWRRNVALVTLKEDRSELQRYEITENCHSQIADFLKIPYRYYHRLLDDHRDLVLTQVNALLEREPAMRMIRTLDGRARAFVSDRFKRIDNAMILGKTLPALFNGSGELPQNRVIGSHLGEDYMRLRVLWTDPGLEQHIGTTDDGKDDTIKPGFEMFNSETGRGRFVIRGFFWRDYCENGCIWGRDDAITYERYHLGGRLKQSVGMEIFSGDTQRKDDEAMVAQITDIMKALGDRDLIQRMGNALRDLKTGEQIAAPTKAVEVLAKEVGLYEAELDDVLTGLIVARDMSRWGALNAITAVANLEKTSETRAFELQEVGAQLLDMSAARWSRIANAGLLRSAA